MVSHQQNHSELFLKRRVRHTQKVKNFLSKWNNLSLGKEEILIDYKKICKDLLYEDEELVRETIEILLKNIQVWTYNKSPIYKDLFDKSFIDKTHLLNKELWYVKDISYKEMSTSGSTTGASFSYLRWDKFLHFIECENHYDLILDEFEINDNPNILFFFDLKIEVKGKIEIKDSSKNFMENHGTKRKAIIHYVNFNEYNSRRRNLLDTLIDHVKKHQIDVMLTSGPKLNSLCNYLERYGINLKIAKLLSNTNEKLLNNSIKFIKNKNTFDYMCDHMRCWDGGATFFTCKAENYHLMDNISWATEIDKKLICTDYFSLASPFINYWNGDLCKIENNTYKRCECGRLFREFEFLENRPFLIKGKSIAEIKEKFKFDDRIKEIRCSENSIELISNCQINLLEQKNIICDIHNLLHYQEENDKEILKIKFSHEPKV